jgi:hypothetical protein
MAKVLNRYKETEAKTSLSNMKDRNKRDYDIDKRFKKILEFEKPVSNKPRIPPNSPDLTVIVFSLLF